MKKPSLPERLAVALLSEIASGHYSERTSFLSRREIMRQWKVSSPTATQSLRILTGWDILSANARSGHHFRPDFLQRALLRLNQTQLSPLPGQPTWDDRARNLRRQETTLQRIAVVSIGDRLTTGPLSKRHSAKSPEMARSIPIRIPSQSIFSEANEAGVAVDFYLDNGEATTGEQIVRDLIAARMQGVIILRRLLAASVAPIAEPLLKAGIPVVAVFDDCEHLKMVSVNFNNVGLGYKAAQAFIAAGHRRLATVLPPDLEAPNYYRDRFLGCRLAAREFNAAHPEERVTVAPLSIPLTIGKVSTRALKIFNKKTPRRVTALLSTSVNLLEALEATFQAGGIGIPEDLSVIMCSSTPLLSTKGGNVDIMKLDFEEIGQQAFKALQSLFNSQFTEKAWLVDSRHESHGTICPVSR